MITLFENEVAKAHGVNESIILHKLYFWIEKNQLNGKNFYDDKYWTYNSIKAFCDMFPFLSEKQIRTALKSLEEQGLICTGNYNKHTYDRTKWYSLTERAFAYYQKGNSICPTGQMDTDKRANASAEKGEPIPVSIPISETIDNSFNNSHAGVREEENIKDLSDKEKAIHNSFIKAVEGEFSTASYKSFFEDKLRLAIEGKTFYYCTDRPPIHQAWLDFEKKLQKLFVEIAGEEYSVAFCYSTKGASYG